ncbi:MAG: nucleotidyl transferase AbiEii/AbiGii toxin family protein [Chloroflexi bacterium]|nr:nucleotidyl transferase AbiEii/AbiGii toxin family protein [Chloroflexota bacterium]
MSTNTPRNIVASVRERLRTLARQHREDFNFTLMRYANERFLYRVSQSAYRQDFVLKGAMLLPLWGADIARPTRDIDLLGFGNPAAEQLGRVFSDIAALPVEPDGMVYHADHLTLEPIQGTQDYGGVRVRIPANLGNMRLPVQLDIAFGDAITPAPQEAAYPTLLSLPAPVLRMYPLETVVAEKFEAMVRFALANSRLKDYYDLWSLARTQAVEGASLVEAIGNTFVRRGTPVPVTVPTGLSPGFYDDAAKQRQWNAFLKRVAPVEPPTELRLAVELLTAFLMPPAIAAVTQNEPPGRWRHPQGWQ